MNLEAEPKHAKLTRFLCQELLYEYAIGTLEGRRRADVEVYLSGCRDSQRELENLRKGIAYADSVSHIDVSGSLHQALLAFEPPWKRRLQAWTLWSSQRGWQLLPLFFLIFAVGLGLAVTKPWHRDRRDQDQVLAVQAPGQPSEAERARSTTPPGELGKVADLNVSPATAPSLLVGAVPSPEVAVAAAANPAADTEEESAEVPPPAEVLPGTGKGAIVRGELTVSSFAVNWPKVREKIASLQGKQAGAVELGWLRHPGESYFHFSIPESNYADLDTFLKTLGPVRFSRERHPRVMPKGQIRIILSVKDGEPHESAAEAP